MKISTHKTERDQLPTINAFVDECIASNEVPTSQAIVDSVLEALDWEQSRIAYLAACLILDRSPIIEAATALLEGGYIPSSDEFKAFKSAVVRAGKWAAKNGYQARDGLDLERATIKAGKAKEGRYTPVIDEAANDGRSNRKGKGEPDSEKQAEQVDQENLAKVKLTGPELVLALCREYGIAQVEKWIDKAAVTMGNDAAQQFAKGHKPVSVSKH